MSETIIIECDHEGVHEFDMCLNKFNGFEVSTSKKIRKEIMIKRGWIVKGDKHYCPEHSDKKEEYKK